MRIHGGALLLAVALGALPAMGAEPIIQGFKDDDVVAKVNGTPIQRRAVRDVVRGMLVVSEREPDEEMIRAYTKDALASLVDLELLFQDSMQRGIVVPESAVDDELARTKQRFPDSKTFAAALKAQGTSEAELRRDTRKTLAVSRLLEAVVLKDVQVESVQIREFYEQNRAEFRHPAQVRASHILVRVEPKAKPAEVSMAQAKAAALLEQIKAGADFAALARQSSDDPGSAANGGDVGYFSSGDMMPEFEKQALQLEVGAVSGVVRTQYGFDVIKVTDRREAGVQPLAEVEERIRAVLLKEARQQRQAEYAAKLRQQAKIEYPAAL